MKKGLKRIVTKSITMGFVFAMTLCAGLYCSGQSVHAETVYTDKEDNDSYETAQYISRNTQTPAQAASSRTSSNYRYVTGTLSNDDEDWYRVYLYSDENIYLDMGVGTGTIFVELYDSSDLNFPIEQYEFTSFGNDNVYEVWIPSDNNYYLKVYHTTTSLSSTYHFTIGNPQYSKGVYTHTFERITLNAKATWERTVDLTEVLDIPDEAIAYEISIGGCNSSVSSKRYFYNNSFDKWVATKTTYSYSLPVTEASVLDQEWGTKIVSTSSSRSTFTPTMTIRYVAPDLP